MVGAARQHDASAIVVNEALSPGAWLTRYRWTPTPLDEIAMPEIINPGSLQPRFLQSKTTPPGASTWRSPLLDSNAGALSQAREMA